MEVESRNAELCGYGDRLLCRSEQLLGPVRVDEVASDIASHRGERGAGGPQAIYVVCGPIPHLHLKTKIIDPARTLGNGQLSEDHLRTGSQGELGHHRAS